METQTVENTNTLRNTMFLYGKVHQQVMLELSGRVSVIIGRWPAELELYFEDEQQFKAFVGEMIKAVANLK